MIRTLEHPGIAAAVRDLHPAMHAHVAEGAQDTIGITSDHDGFTGHAEGEVVAGMRPLDLETIHLGRRIQPPGRVARLVEGTSEGGEIRLPHGRAMVWARASHQSR